MGRCPAASRPVSPNGNVPPSVVSWLCIPFFPRLGGALSKRQEFGSVRRLPLTSTGEFRKIGAGRSDISGGPEATDHGHEARAVPMDLGQQRSRVTEAAHDQRYLLREARVELRPDRSGAPVDGVVSRAARQEYVNPERLTGCLVANAFDVLSQLVGSHVAPGRDHTEPARGADGRRQRRVRHVPHARLDNRCLEAKRAAELSRRRVHPADATDGFCSSSADSGSRNSLSAFVR